MFIVVTDNISEREYMVNLNNIVCITKNTDEEGEAYIYFVDEGYLVVKESYEEVKRRIKEAE